MPTDEMFGLRRKLLENSYISVAKSKTGDDGQLPTGWHLLTCWHFTAGRFNCRTSGALPTYQQNAGTRANVYARSAINRRGMAFAFPRAWGDTEMDNLICRALLPVEIPVGLTHLDSDLCWCDPIVEVDEDGEHVLLHRQVTWN